MNAQAITHKTALQWAEELADGVIVVHPDGFDDVNPESYLMSKEEFEDRLFQSVFTWRTDNKIWQEPIDL